MTYSITIYFIQMYVSYSRTFLLEIVEQSSNTIY